MTKKVLIVLFFPLMFACTNTSTNNKQYNTVDEMIEDAKKQVNYISLTDFNSVLESHNPFYLIDCREEDEFSASCIKGAINIPRGILEGVISEKAPKHLQSVYIYCDNGNRSTFAALTLELLKYSNVKVIEGGFDALQAELPTLVELNPMRDAVETKTVAKPSGGCGG